ncbi:MAG: molybdate ABC transporter substrate-binding protein, partial [Treponemataceae bacterium]
GALNTQIRNGAPFQIFMSADNTFPAKLYVDGFAAGPEKVYATGALILLSSTARDFSAGLAILNDGSVERFAIANPETAPYGKAALEALTALGLWETIKVKAVTAQTITQAVQYTVTATGLGFVNKSALYTKDLAPFTDKEGVNWIAVDPSTHAPIEQAFIVIKSAANDPAAKAFADFLSSDAAKTVFKKFGYSVPK